METWASSSQDFEVGNQPNQMKIIGQQNETIGNISLTNEQLTSILASKTDGGIVTLHLQNEDGIVNPVQLQIVPEEQVYQPVAENTEVRDVTPEPAESEVCILNMFIPSDMNTICIYIPGHKF